MSGGGRILELDSALFGMTIAVVDDGTHSIDWARANGVACLFLLLDAADTQAIQKAESKGFNLMDVRVTLERRASRFQLASAVRACEDADLDELARIARESHRITRFYADPKLDDDRCDDLYEGWLRNSYDGWAQQVLVRDDGSGAAGYVTVHREDDRASIGLIAVDKERRGRYIGSALMRSAVDWAAHDGARTISVVTQGRNIPALRLFESSGFKITGTGVWLHRHLR